MTNTALIPDDQGTLRRVFGGGSTFDTQEQIKRLEDQLKMARQELDQAATRHGSERAELLAAMARNSTTAQLEDLKRQARAASDGLQSQLAQEGQRHREAIGRMQQEQRSARELLARQSEMVRKQRDEALSQLSVLAGVSMHLTEQLQVARDLLRVKTGAPVATVTYQLRPEISWNDLVGATTTEPTVNRVLDVYRLLHGGAGGLIGDVGTGFMLGDGANTLETITVMEGGPQDEALSGFPTLLEKI